MAVRSDRLFGPVVLPAGGFALLCEVPPSQVWIVKSMRFVAITAESCFFDVRLDPDNVNTSLFCETVLTGRGITLDSTWQILDTGEQLHGRASVADAAVVWASGAKLNL